MKISWIPFGNIDTASSRLRVYSLHEEILKKYQKIDSFIGYDKKSDVLIVSKKLTDDVLKYVKEFKGLKIFDFIDNLTNETNFIEMVSNCDIILTNNIYRKKQIDDLNLNTKCIILDDCIDYNIHECCYPKKNSGNIVWFGTKNTIHSMVPIFDFLVSAKKDMDMFIITKKKDELDSTFLERYKNSKFSYIPWCALTFPHILQCFGTSILSHRGDNSVYKSNNKLLVNIAAGIPTLVDCSFSYQHLLSTCGLDDFIIKEDLGNLNELMSRLSIKSEKIKYLSKCQKYVLDNYCVSAITKKLLKIIEESTK